MVQVRADNHWLDCEVGIMAAAVITGTIKLKDTPVKKAVEGGRDARDYRD